MKSLVFHVLVSVILLFQLGASEASQVGLKPDDSCIPLRQAYLATRKTDIYRETIYALDAKGSSKKYAEIRYRGDRIFQELESDGRWDEFKAPLVFPELRLTNCTFSSGSAKNVRYYAVWHSGDNKDFAATDVWIARGSSLKIEKAIRYYPSANSQFPFLTVLSVFDYDEDKAKLPPISKNK